MARSARARPSLTRDQVVDAALRLADEEGLAALSMRRLGQALDAGAASLYWHVPNRDALLDLVVDRVLGELPVPPAGDEWPVALRGVADGLREVLGRHPGVAAILATRPAFTPNTLRALEGPLGALRAAGFPPEEALLATTTLVNVVASLAGGAARGDPPALPADDDARRAVLGARIAALPADAFPSTAATAAASLALTPARQLDYALDVLIEGIAVREARRAGPSPGDRPGRRAR